MTIQFSRRLAIVGGILIPLLETIRRWSTWKQAPASLFDDYIIGAFLLYGAWRTGKDLRSGQRFLAAAWAWVNAIRLPYLPAGSWRSRAWQWLWP
jgi:hypothetical protein